MIGGKLFLEWDNSWIQNNKVEEVTDNYKLQLNIHSVFSGSQVEGKQKKVHKYFTSYRKNDWS